LQLIIENAIFIVPYSSFLVRARLIRTIPLFECSGPIVPGPAFSGRTLQWMQIGEMP
jgi:hypothetical protein